MGLDAVLRNGVKVINGVTKAAQTKIVLHRWSGQSYDGSPLYAAPLTLTAVVEHKTEARQSTTGQIRISRTFVIILEPLTALGAPGRSEPLEDRDMITLPNMTTGAILETYGVVDAATGLPYAHEVRMGDRR